jgi:type I restriction enzyme S subunit
VPKVNGPGVVIGRYGTLGEVHYIDRDFWPLNTSLYVKDFKGNDRRFCAYLLETIQVAKTGVASAVPGVNRNVLHELSAPCPSIDEQRRIASILGAYDDLVENHRRRIAILDEMSRQLFEEWFIQFRFPGHGQHKMIDTVAGAIPVGWTVELLSSALRFNRGRSYRSVDLAEDGGLPFVNLKCFMRDGGFRADGLKRYVGDYKPEQLVTSGDIVMAVTDMTQERRIVGQAARIPRLDQLPAVLSMDVVKVVPKSCATPEFLYHWMRYSGFSAKAAQHANGANVLHLSPQTLLDLPIVLPPMDRQKCFSQFASRLSDLSDTLAKAEVRLLTSRDLLLPRLISGELPVSAAERELEAAD